MQSYGCIFIALIIIIIALVIYIIQYQSSFSVLDNTLKDGDDITPTILEQYNKSNHNKIIIVYFYAPWCGYCKKMSPIYEEFATKGKKYGFKAVKINADKFKPDKKYNVQGFPTIVGIKGNSITTYKASRDVNNLTMFAKSL